mmetsp:Transcript_7499/g.18150  ORF Transcript_7499/g.18150 Transcript_7499/m.18150 type:complete len:80 (+) Transcript_7499:1324-1563(+)
MRVSWHDGTPQQARSAAFGTPSHASCFEYSVPSGPLRTSGKGQCPLQGLVSITDSFLLQRLMSSSKTRSMLSISVQCRD